MAVETRLVFRGDSVASQVESQGRDAVINHFNNTTNYNKHLHPNNRSKLRKFVDLSLPQNSQAKSSFIDDLNELLGWAGIPPQRYEELIH
jgi:hypothetical protein